MYLLDTNVISEFRKGSRADVGVRKLFQDVQQEEAQCYLSVVTVGELRRGIEQI